MKLGVCTSIDRAADVLAAGFDFIEGNVQSLCAAHTPDAEWRGDARVRGSAIHVLSGNLLMPGEMKIVGPAVDVSALRTYLSTVIDRAAKIGMTTLVFGSGIARRVPNGFDFERANDQLISFLTHAGDVAARSGLTIVIEPLNRYECNILNTLAEAVAIASHVDSPAVKCLVDTYHSWVEGEPFDEIVRALPWIRHVHLADKLGRVAPGESGQSDYRPLFAALRQAGYGGMISIEAKNFDIAEAGPRVRRFLDDQWTHCI